MNEMGSILGLSIATGLCLIVIAVWRLRVRHIDAAEQEREREATAKAMQDGTLNKDGLRACVVCGAPATEYMPMSGVSWMDKLPLLNRLFSLPPATSSATTSRVTSGCA